ncbi:hypothetical protein PPGU19_088990 (plasmid) [Paraburkholderia sp. PGU19]|nr:hypothetical protein PPGU19_088990 [Paraburkholderia sp. PGU19]
MQQSSSDESPTRVLSLGFHYCQILRVNGKHERTHIEMNGGAVPACPGPANIRKDPRAVATRWLTLRINMPHFTVSALGAFTLGSSRYHTCLIGMSAINSNSVLALSKALRMLTDSTDQSEHLKH